ncbi:hypothetical protein [Leptolyngbya subtilissima]
MVVSVYVMVFGQAPSPGLPTGWGFLVGDEKRDRSTGQGQQG